ncbi:MAG: S23 ribosomal [Parcubacteria group bacterium GW2011_GWA1_59_11]|nr:MAG: S23 ribosomal [Parcubacteria group bacterium GW2011_GWA1_59_11]
MEKGYKKLRVYAEAHKLTIAVYQITENFPKSEVFGLTSQMRRAAVSVVANILEGQARSGKKEFKQFLFVANGSLVELEYYFELARDLGYISAAEYGHLEMQRRTTGSLLGGLIKHLKLDT